MTLSFNNHKGVLRGAASLAALTLTFAFCSAAHADVRLAGSVGIAKRYRPNGWVPVTVFVQKSDSDTLHGQVQAFADPDPITQNRRNQPNVGPPPAVFSTTATLAGPAGATGAFRLYVRNIDPLEDNLTLQYRAGDERGDGAVLAKLPMNGTRMANIAGLPVQGSDPWVISISSDPAAFTFLNGRKLGLVHTHSGARDATTVPKDPNQNLNGMHSALVPPAVQVTPAGLADLPDRAAGYSGVDAMIIRCDAPLDGLTEAQSDAIRNWVASGGHLVVTSGADPSGLNASLLHNLLPASVNPTTHNVPFLYANQQFGEVAATMLTPKPMPGVKVLKSTGIVPLIITGSYGVGRVTVTAFDPTSTIFNAWQGGRGSAFWRMVLTGGDTQPSSILAYVAGREEADQSYGYYGTDAQLKSALIRAPSFDAPPVGAIALYLVIYIVVLVPLNYLVLKRMDRREWAWVTVPALVIVFAGATYAVGYAAKGGQLFVNRVSIAETTSGSSVAGVFSAIGIFSPHRRSYDVGIDDPSALICQPNTYRNYYGSQEDDSDVGDGATARFFQGGSEPRVQDAAINMWAMRTFDVIAARDMGGAITCKVNKKGGQITGFTVDNATGYRLTGCSLCVESRVEQLSTVPAGSHAAINLDIPIVPDLLGTGTGQQMNQFPQTAFNDVDDSAWSGDDITSRMKRGTIEFVKGLGNEDSDYWWARSSISAEPRMRYKPRPGEAIFSAWAEGNGPIAPGVAVDGAAPKENGLTLVIVHIPLNGAAS